MKIEGNQKELDAMVEFHKGNRVEGPRKVMQETLFHQCNHCLKKQKSITLSSITN